MQEYQVYLLSRDNNIIGATWLALNPLQAAIIEVASKYPDRSCENWEGLHRLVTVGPDSN